MSQPEPSSRLTFDDVVVRYAETEAWGGESRWLVDTAGELDHDAIFAQISAALARGLRG